VVIRIRVADQDSIKWQVRIDTVAGWVTTVLIRKKYCGNQDKVQWQVRIG